MRSRRSAPGAFSLVEVVLALGVSSFCLVVLLGLFGVGFSNNSKSRDDTNLAAMTWQVAGNLRSQTNPAGWTNNPGGLTNGMYYFDVDGQVLTNASSPVHPAYYECNVLVLPPAPANLPNGLVKLIQVGLKFTYRAFSTNATTRVLTNYVLIPPP